MQQFPISSYLSEICEKLKTSESHFLILTAETGAGKSTVLPIGLLENFSGKIIMTEPRRLAAVGVANRTASLLEEKCGMTAGYRVHLENCTGKETRLEVVTEAVLVKILSEDPLIENYNVVVIDEFHERTVHTDLNLALLKEAVSVRDDLFVIIMSATIDTEKLQKYIGDSTAVMKIPGRTFPIDCVYEPDFSVCDAIMKEVEKPLFFQKSDEKNFNGDILAFLPGIKDILECHKNLTERLVSKNLFDRVKLYILHSSISFEEQKKILNKTDPHEKRIILSSAIAETSVTVPDISIVIDSGFSRVSRLDVRTQMQNLVTEIESEFSAEQRKGRAGRIAKGKCIRLWSAAEPRVKNMPPEILRTDLSEFVLECFSHGITSPDKIELLDKPSDAAFNQCLNLLKKLSLITENQFSLSDKNPDSVSYSLTQKGKAALSIPLNPRLCVIALSAGVKAFDTIENIILENSSYSKSNRDLQNRFLNDIKLRVSRCPDFSMTASKEILLLQGFPDRLALRLSEYGAENPVYQFSNGRKAVVCKEKKTFSKWIVAQEVIAGKTDGVIYSFTEITEQDAEDFLKLHKEKNVECRFENGKIIKSENICFGKIILSSKKLVSSDEDLLAAWITEVKTKGFNSLPLDEKTEKFILRTKFYQSQKLKNDISCFEKNLCDKAEEWLTPFFSGVKKLTSETVYDALYYYLNGSEIDRCVPEFLVLPNNTKAKIKYEEMIDENQNTFIRPVIEIIIQRIFGCTKTPEICGVKVLLRLLSPASRPLQITDDLEHFWIDSWPEICREMKGRYPKHNWEW
ncbi:MAG: ATP-dependent RNA helicase [Treponema sp.]|nr:ATP-dependent RNA helicase [Candidatus Treponema merdequi]